MDEREKVIQETELKMSYADCYSCGGTGFRKSPYGYLPNERTDIACRICNGTGKAHKSRNIFNEDKLGNIG